MLPLSLRAKKVTIQFRAQPLVKGVEQIILT